MNHIIQVESITKKYPKATYNSLDNVSFTIGQGERVGIVGLNGAGKSTLLKIIMGILQPSAGTVNTFGTNPMKNRKKIASKLGVVFGQRTQLQWDIPVIDSYELLGAIYGIPNIDKRIETFEKYFYLEQILNKPVRSLSLGQKMIAEFVGIMIHDPELIILDEPTIGLDLEIKKKMINSIKNLDTNKTIIFTSHILEDIYDVCDRVIIINRGKKVFDGSMREIDRSHTPAKVIITLAQDELILTGPKYDVQHVNYGVFEVELNQVAEISQFLQEVTRQNTILNLDVKTEKLERLIKTLQE